MVSAPDGFPSVKGIKICDKDVPYWNTRSDLVHDSDNQVCQQTKSLPVNLMTSLEPADMY